MVSQRDDLSSPAEALAGRRWRDPETALMFVARARTVLVTARAGHAGPNMTQRVQQIDDLLAHVPE